MGTPDVRPLLAAAAPWAFAFALGGCQILLGREEVVLDETSDGGDAAQGTTGAGGAPQAATDAASTATDVTATTGSSSVTTGGEGGGATSSSSGAGGAAGCVPSECPSGFCDGDTCEALCQADCELGAPCADSDACFGSSTCVRGRCTPNDIRALWIDRAAPYPGESTYRIELAYDPVGARVVSVGGQSGFFSPQIERETFAWDGETWTTLSNATSPSGGGGVFLWHQAAATFIAFGMSGDADQTYLWDGVSAWDAATVASEASPRVDTTGAYAPDGSIWMFGGRLDTKLDDLWRFDGVAWNAETPGGSVPSARAAHGVAWDVARGEMVLFGGLVSGESLPAETDPATYLFDGTDFRVAAAGNDPPKRYGGALLYDPLRERVVLYGGYNNSNAPLPGLWEWDGASWRAIAAWGGSPSAPISYDCSFVFDASRARAVYVPAVYDEAVDDLPATPPTWELVTLGNACTTDAECGTGFCVDHVCCIQSCPADRRCNLPSSPGECLVAQ